MDDDEFKDADGGGGEGDGDGGDGGKRERGHFAVNYDYADKQVILSILLLSTYLALHCGELSIFNNSD